LIDASGNKIDRYEAARAARSAADLQLDDFAPLHQALARAARIGVNVGRRWIKSLIPN
jgi:hypothetical protein